jgi:hypothetical protein
MDTIKIGDKADTVFRIPVHLVDKNETHHVYSKNEDQRVCLESEKKSLFYFYFEGKKILSNFNFL